MTIEQKKKRANDRLWFAACEKERRLGIIEGIKMAAQVAEQWDENSPYNSRAAAIRALIEEQKP